MNAAERFLFERSAAGGHVAIPLEAAWGVISGAWPADSDLRRTDKEMFASVTKLVVELCSQREQHVTDELYRRWRAELNKLVEAEKARRAGGEPSAAAEAAAGAAFREWSRRARLSAAPVGNAELATLFGNARSPFPPRPQNFCRHEDDEHAHHVPLPLALLHLPRRRADARAARGRGMARGGF